jgi:hypothetical protein
MVHIEKLNDEYKSVLFAAYPIDGIAPELIQEKLRLPLSRVENAISSLEHSGFIRSRQHSQNKLIFLKEEAKYGLRNATVFGDRFWTAEFRNRNLQNLMQSLTDVLVFRIEANYPAFTRLPLYAQRHLDAELHSVNATGRVYTGRLLTIDSKSLPIEDILNVTPSRVEAFYLGDDLGTTAKSVPILAGDHFEKYSVLRCLNIRYALAENGATSYLKQRMATRLVSRVHGAFADSICRISKRPHTGF